MSRFYPSAFYFIYFGALAVVSPFLVLYYQQLGLTGAQIGVLLGLSPLITLFASPFWTGLADASHRHKTVLMLTLFMAILTTALIPFFHTFNPLLSAVAVLAFFIAPVGALVDSATLSMLAGQHEMYGRIRLWGTIGWGISAPIAGVVLQRYGLQWMFWIYAVLMAFNLFVSRKLVFVRSASASPFWSGLRSVISNRRWMLFLALVFIAGIGLSAHINYMGLLMEFTGGSKSYLGIALLVSTISELPVMFFSYWLLRKLNSRGLLALAVGFAGVRCLLYAYAGSPQAVLMLQLLHGFTFPALWVAGVTYVAEISPEGLGATGQGIFGGILMGFGSAAGGLLGGVLIDQIGISGMYGIIGIVVLLSLGLFLIFDRQSNEGKLPSL